MPGDLSCVENSAHQASASASTRELEVISDSAPASHTRSRRWLLRAASAAFLLAPFRATGRVTPSKSR
ncbi:hypothetical protein FrEUN1fDRAFT_7673 [Parafrankia sp. EUN1f]|nr:hypothetical protein FrEUN1fDRAFT_7673 [Parafrankia sp. EUN1f]